MKHLALITTSFPDRAPGSEAAGSFVADFAATMSQYLRVTVVAPSREESIVGYGNLGVRRFAVPHLPLSLLSPAHPRHWLWIAHTLRAGSKAVSKLAREEKIDHILALWALPSGYWARSVGRNHGIPYSVWALGSDIWSLARMPLIKGILRTVLRDGLVLFADGYLLQQDVMKIAGRDCQFLPSARKLPINGTRRFSDRPPYRLAFLGRWHPNKGTDLLCEALVRLTDQDWQKIQEIKICGGGPLAELVRERCTALREAGRPVTLAGYLDKQAATELLLWTDYLLIPSRIESIPVVFSDAMQAACPVVATPVGDLPRLLKTWRIGILAGEAEAGSFSRAISAALQNPPLSFEPDLQKTAQAFDLEEAAQSFLAKTGLADEVL